MSWYWNHCYPLLLLRFDASVDWIPFVGSYICVDFSCSCWDEFCTPLIIAAKGWFCLSLSLLVVTEAVSLVAIILFLHFSFNACAISGSFSICCWVSHMSRDHYYLPYQLVGFLISTPSSLWFPFHLPCLPRPPQPPRLRSPLPTNIPPLPPINNLPDELTCRICPYLPDNGWVAGKRRGTNYDRYVEYVLNI